MVVQERRRARYVFPSLEALKSFFRDWIPPAEIESSIAKARLTFRVREGTSEQETQWQFVNKCEAALFAMLLGIESPSMSSLGPENPPLVA